MYQIASPKQKLQRYLHVYASKHAYIHNNTHIIHTYTHKITNVVPPVLPALKQTFNLKLTRGEIVRAGFTTEVAPVSVRSLGPSARMLQSLLVIFTKTPPSSWQCRAIEISSSRVFRLVNTVTIGTIKSHTLVFLTFVSYQWLRRKTFGCTSEKPFGQFFLLTIRETNKGSDKANNWFLNFQFLYFLRISHMCSVFTIFSSSFSLSNSSLCPPTSFKI